MNAPYPLTSRRAALFLAILFVITVVFGLGIPRLKVRNSFAGELPANDPINVAIDRVKADFGDRSVVLIGLETDNVYNATTARKVVALTEALAQVPTVKADEVRSLATVQNVSDRSWGLETTPFLADIPTTPAGWAQLRADVAQNATVLGKLVSADGRLVVVAAPLEEGFDGGAVYDAVQALVASFRGPERVHVTGAPVLVEDVQRGISGDSRRLIPIAIVFIFVGFYLCFRRPAGVLLPITMVVMSIVWTMGAMGYLGLPVTVVSNALPVIMVAVASSYGIHFMNAYYDLADQHADVPDLVAATLRRVGTPIVVTGFTSALGSASLLIFRIASLREFGIIGALGFLFATFICLTLLPSLCLLLGPPKGQRRQSHWFNRQLFQLTRWAAYQRRWVWGAYALLLPGCFYLASTIQIGDDYLRFFPEEHPGRVAAERFNEHLSGVRVMDVVVDASAYGDIKDADFYQQLRALQDYLAARPEVGSVHSYLDVVDHLRRTVGEAPNEAPTGPEIAQYLMLFEMSASAGEAFALRTDDYQKARLQVLLRTSNPADHQTLYEAVQRRFPQFFSQPDVAVAFGGDVMGRIALGKYIVQGKVQNIALALLIVLVSCTIVFRSVRRGLFTLLPIVTSLAMVFGGMGLLGIRLGISTSLLTAMIVGIGIDFAVHYLTAYYAARRWGEADNALAATSLHTGKAIAYDALSNVVGFSVLSFSGFLPVQHFGWLLAFSMALIFFNTMILYPATLLDPKHQPQAAWA